MSDPADKKKLATYQDVLDAPPYTVAEIIAGELHVSPRPGTPHAVIASALGGELYSPFGAGRGGPGGWTILDEPELHFRDEVVVPDLAGWREERLPIVPDEPFLTLSPDWICEVLSRSTETRDRLEKMPLYASVGIRHAWLVQAKSRSIEAFRLHDGMWLAIGVYRDAGKARIEPFDAIELDLARLWAKTPQPTRASDGATYYQFEGP
ncbi:MAG: Uma2 family endonuclease [Deltaproteobacteria bacterium]|nr:Uma2 family endonuclease [Deltaproteobacteria bacterium]MDQ3295433.1 Uma2 family endonuclease [Myxococcota bacterium]